MAETYDCIVLGVGGFGSSALYHLAQRKQRVLGIERFDVAHNQGSSHGETRMIRKAYIEHPDYVPLVLRAYDLWHELEEESGRTLLHPSRLLLAGLPDSDAVAGTALATGIHKLNVEKVDRAEAERRFPGFRIPEHFEAMIDHEAGYLEVENSVRTHIERALAAGAVLKTGESVIDWSVEANTVRVRTDAGEYEAARFVVTAGPWTSEVLRDLSIPLKIVRKPTTWHEVTNGGYKATEGSPLFYYEFPEASFYGFPSIDGKTIKLAQHTGGHTVTNPLELDRELHADDLDSVATFLEKCLPGVSSKPARHGICMYTHTPDDHFIIDRHPEFANVVIGAGFSGHGFKFTTVLGQALADFAIDGQTDLPTEFLAIDREALR